MDLNKDGKDDFEQVVQMVPDFVTRTVMQHPYLSLAAAVIVGFIVGAVAW